MDLRNLRGARCGTQCILGSDASAFVIVKNTQASGGEKTFAARLSRGLDEPAAGLCGVMEEEIYVRYYVGHKGQFGHEFLEFEIQPNGKVRWYWWGKESAVQ